LPWYALGSSNRPGEGETGVGFSVRESAAAVDVPTKTPRYVAELTVGGGSVSWLHPATAAAVSKAMAQAWNALG
jgi:hypothetical protein